MGTPYLPIPFQTAVDVDFNKGNTLISFIGDIPEKAERFQIRLETADNDNVGLFFEPDLEAGYIIRKALKSGQWSKEEKAGPCPLKAGGPFEILVLIEKEEYDIAVNGERFTQFQHRIPPNQIKKIVVDGDVNLVGINLFHESSDDFEGNPNVRSEGHGGGGEETIVPKNATKNKADNYYGTSKKDYGSKYPADSSMYPNLATITNFYTPATAPSSLPYPIAPIVTLPPPVPAASSPYNSPLPPDIGFNIPGMHSSHNFHPPAPIPPPNANPHLPQFNSFSIYDTKPDDTSHLNNTNAFAPTNPYNQNIASFTPNSPYSSLTIGNQDYYGGGGGASNKSDQSGYKPSGGYGTDVSGGGGDSGNYQPSGGYGDNASGGGGGDSGNYQSGGGYGGGNNSGGGGGGYQPSGGYGDSGMSGGGDGGQGNYGGGQAQQTFPGRKSKFDFAQGSGLIGAAATAIGAYAINKYLNRPQGGGGMGGMGGGGMGGFGGMGGGGGGGGNPLANMILGAVGSAAGSQMGYSMTNQIPGMNTLQKHGVPTGMIGSLLGSIMGSKMVRGNH